MKPKTVKLVLPLPDKHLSPNARLHWAVKAKATRRAREMSHATALRELLGSRPKWRTATVQATFYRKTRRKVDPDNALASLKPTFDGLKDAGLIADDSGLTHLPVRSEVDRENPRLEIEVRNVD